MPNNTGVETVGYNFRIGDRRVLYQSLDKGRLCRLSTLLRDPERLLGRGLVWARLDIEPEQRCGIVLGNGAVSFVNPYDDDDLYEWEYGPDEISLMQGPRIGFSSPTALRSTKVVVVYAFRQDKGIRISVAPGKRNVRSPLRTLAKPSVERI